MATASDDLEMYRQLLLPWLRALRRAGLSMQFPPLHTISDLEDLWLCVSLPSGSDLATWSIVVEAMELMELLARVDRNLAWRLLYENGDGHTQRIFSLYGDTLWTREQAPRLPRFAIGFQGGQDRRNDDVNLLMLRRLIQTDSHIMSTSYKDTVAPMLSAKVEALMERALDRDIDGYVDVRLDVEITTDEESNDTAALESLLSSIQLLFTGSRNASQRPSPLIQKFKFDSCRLDFSQKPLNDAVANQLGELQDAGVCVSHILLPPIWYAQLDASTAERLVNHQFVTHRDVQSLSGGRHTTVHVSGLDEEGLRRSFTVIAHCRTNHKMVFDADYFTDAMEEDVLDEEDPNLAPVGMYWTWMAYALFHRNATHSIAAVTMNAKSLTSPLVQAMREVLVASDPLAILGPSTTTRSHRADEALQVFPSIWSPFLKPTPEIHESITHLTIESWTTESVQPIIDLLELVGRPLTRLTLNNLGPSPRCVLLDAVFVHCPNLQRLELDVCDIETLDWFQYRYRPCHTLQTLSIGEMSVTELTSWPRIFTTLCDSLHPLTKSLRHLHVNFQELSLPLNYHAAMPVGEAMYEALVRMLDENKRLERVEVSQCATRMVAAYQDRVLAHQNEELPPDHDVCAQKRAFLSVVAPITPTANRTDEATHAPHRGKSVAMSSDIAALIFEFAHSSRRRICGFYPGRFHRHHSLY